MATDKQPILGKVPFSALFEDLAFFPYTTSSGAGSKTHSLPGYFFISIKKPGKTEFNKREGGKEWMLYAKPTQLLKDTYNGNAISGIGSFEILGNSPHWTEQGGALVIARDDVMISSAWIGLVDLDDLPDMADVATYNLLGVKQ